jgi:hypothetical protein
VTEPEARAALRAFIAVGELERWIAVQRWEAVPGGWRVRFQSWHCRGADRGRSGRLHYARDTHQKLS